MEDWRQETADDLRDAELRIEGVIPGIRGEPDTGQLRSVWRAYLDVEKSIAFIRVDLDEENPGRFISQKQYSVPDERQALQFSLKSLRKGSQSFALGDFRQALKELRESRNYLRVLLKEKRRLKTRTAKGKHA
ncbi:MAG: hypothetical protein OK438_08060 [Thaumarchaeota archaeon]|nr:hypothetical protein [Nitrososphaerota archaeon]